MRLTRRLFFIGLGLTAMIAVGSYWWQLPGLAGSRGIAPIGGGLDGLRGAGDVGFFDAPTLLWLSSSDAMLHLLCALAFLSAALLVAGIALRLLTPVGLLYAGSLLAGAAIALANVLLPAFVKREFLRPEHEP